MGSPVRGQLTESPTQLAPAATHTTLGASKAAEVTSTSSQLATTVSCGWRAMPSRSRRSMMLISPTRSSWSRDRFSKTRTSGFRASETCGTWSSSTSRAASGFPRVNDRVAIIPASMLAPSACVATGPTPDRAAASIRVVVDLPLVPVTNAVRRPTPRRAMIDGSTFMATRPPIIDPLPRPAARDAQRAEAAAASARRVRAGSRDASDMGSSFPHRGAAASARFRLGGKCTPPAWGHVRASGSGASGWLWRSVVRALRESSPEEAG